MTPKTRAALESAKEVLSGWPGQALQSALTLIEQALAEPEPQPGNAVASLYITPDGGRELDDWKVELPVGRNLLYTATPPVQTPTLQYPLPDDLYDSKDWRDGGYAQRVEWLHLGYEDAKQEISRLEEQLSSMIPKDDTLIWVTNTPFTFVRDDRAGVCNQCVAYLDKPLCNSLAPHCTGGRFIKKDITKRKE